MAAVDQIEIRPARQSDAAEIAEVHVESWRDSYAGVLPDAYLLKLSVATRTARWSRQIADPANPIKTLVAESDDGVVGFASYGGGKTGAEGEVHALYVAGDWRDRGIGRELIRAAFAALRDKGYRRVAVWCLEANTAARGFYLRCGGKLLPGGRMEEVGGFKLPVVGYLWEF